VHAGGDDRSPLAGLSGIKTQQQICSAVNWSGVNILAGRTSVPLISEHIGTNPHWKFL